MGMLDKIFGKKKSKLVVLTELGKHKSEDLVGSQGIRLKIVSYLDDKGESSISEIAAGTGFQAEQVKVMVEKLQREQWVTTVKSPSGD
jgi:predicted transcriptional regulator